MTKSSTAPVLLPNPLLALLLHFNVKSLLCVARGGAALALAQGLMSSYGLELVWADLLLVLAAQIILKASFDNINEDCKMKTDLSSGYL